MKNKNNLIIGVVVLVIIGVALYFGLSRKHEKAVAKHPYDFSGPCPGETKTMKMTDASMRGIIEEGHEFKLISNFYWCNEVKKGDILVLRFSQSLPPVVRKVYAVPGDEFAVNYNKNQKAWNVEIGEEVLKVDGAPYFFGAADPNRPPPLKLLETSRDGVLLDREIIVFSAHAPSFQDSSTLGVVNLNDVLGKVE